MLKVHSIETLGTHEGPGLRLVVFLQGCKFNCIYCHNPDTIPTNNSDGSRCGRDYTTEQILELVKKEKPYFGKKGGITFSGGEPLLQAKDILPVFQKLKLNGDNQTHTVLDTNGGFLNDGVKELLKYTDLVLLDIKHIDSEKHKILTGRDNKTTLEFANYLEQNHIPFWIRHVLVPGHTDSEDDLDKLGRHFKDYKYLERLEILPYHTYGIEKYKELGLEYKCKNITPPNDAEISFAKNKLKEYIKDVRVR